MAHYNIQKKENFNSNFINFLKILNTKNKPNYIKAIKNLYFK